MLKKIQLKRKLMMPTTQVIPTTITAREEDKNTIVAPFVKRSIRHNGRIVADVKEELKISMQPCRKDDVSTGQDTSGGQPHKAYILLNKCFLPR